jgi:benzoyl-CoA reductase/2-hydroxyglutaryl-CoA dehydratase subunit BcrC/BadD/HgdB
MTARDTLHRTYAGRHSLTAPGTPVGCITQAVPMELILAAGLAPCRIFGDPATPPDRGDRYMEEEIDGEVRSIFDQLLRGRHGALPLILLPRVSEQHLQLHYYIAEVRTWEPEAPIPPVQIVDVMQTGFWSTGRYVHARMAELAARLGALGTPPTPRSLRDAIAATNSMRHALIRVNGLRREGRIAGSDLFRLTALFGAMPVDEFLALADRLAFEAGPPAAGPRLMLSGAAQDDPTLYEVIEAEGAHVAADDHVAGERIFSHLIDETLDPIEAIAEHYHLHAPGIRQFPQKPQDERFLATCRAAIDGLLSAVRESAT